MNYKVIKNAAVFDSECEKYNIHFPLGDEAVLSSPVSIGKRQSHNSIVYQAMEGCDGTPDGEPGELTKRRYERFARGGAGIIWFEATAVLRQGRANKRQLYINENTLESFKFEVESIKNICFKENGFEPIVICQLTHSGRYSKPDGIPNPRIAYNCPPLQKGKSALPHTILSDRELDEICEALIHATSLAQRAGFDGVDIKSCHRYLLSELLSAYTRPGKYGGVAENRMRMLLTVVREAKILNPEDFIVSSRINAYDGIEYPLGFGMKKDRSLSPDLSDVFELVKELYNSKIDMINVTMGNPYYNPHVNRPFSSGIYEPPFPPLSGVKLMLDSTAEIKRFCPGIPVVCSALSYLGAMSAAVAAGYIQNGSFDLAGWGRMTLAYPMLANDICKGQGLDSNKLCLTCGKCSEIMRTGGCPGCVVRDSKVYLPEYKEFCVEEHHD